MYAADVAWVSVISCILVVLKLIALSAFVLNLGKWVEAVVLTQCLFQWTVGGTAAISLYC